MMHHYFIALKSLRHQLEFQVLTLFVDMNITQRCQEEHQVKIYLYKLVLVRQELRGRHQAWQLDQDLLEVLSHLPSLFLL